MNRAAMSKTSFRNFAHAGEAAEGVKQVQERRIGGAKLTDQGIRTGFQQLRNAFRILMQTRRGHDETDVVLTTAPCATSHLLQFGGSQLSPPVTGACVRSGKHYS